MRNEMPVIYSSVCLYIYLIIHSLVYSGRKSTGIFTFNNLNLT